MAGRPKNPNRPPTVTAVRLTERAFKKLMAMHIGNEPYGYTVERALDQMGALRKKVVGLQLEIEGLQTEVQTKITAFERLFNVHNDTKRQLMEVTQ